MRQLIPEDVLARKRPKRRPRELLKVGEQKKKSIRPIINCSRQSGYIHVP